MIYNYTENQVESACPQKINAFVSNYIINILHYYYFKY